MKSPFFGNRVTVFLASLIWTLVVAVSLWSQRGQLNHTAESMAKIDATTNLKKDMAIRKWAASVGGVYIEANRLPRIDTLEEQDHVAGVKASGEPFKLVALTPIHILQAIQEVSNKEYGIKERLTSKQLRNRNNAPDDWEEKALKSLEKGAEIATEAVPKKGGHGLMRVMIPMRMEDECLECHRDTLVPVGGLRGGAAISVDLNAYRTAQEPAWRSIQQWHIAIWLLGLGTISAFGYFARRHAAEQERQSDVRRENELAFSAMAEGALITDAEGTILWVNDAFCTIYGYLRDEVIGRNPRILKSGRHDAAAYGQLWQQLKNVGYWRGELWNRRKSGEVFPEEISIRALRGHDGQIRRYISIFSDITERKRTDDELKKYREHLEELVRQRTEELTVARDQAEAANRSKSIFLANMSHELRTPLNAVIGFSQLMDKEPSLSETQQRNVEIINRSGNHLLTLINDVLELSKIESGKVSLVEEETSPAELLHEVTDMMRVRAQQAGLTLTLKVPDLPASAWLDAVKLRQVLLNLLSNAVKFTRHGGVLLKVDTAVLENDTARMKFTVSDTGIGISPEDIERIFEPFEQAGSPLSNMTGTGLGLTISRQYLQMMGGELSVESTPGAGSNFSFTLDLRTGETGVAPQYSPGRAIRLAEEDRGRRILVVDDIPEARMLFRDLLEPYGFVVAEAEDGVQVEAQVAAFKPDMILMDWHMPRMDGLEATRRLRSRRPEGQPKVVILTAYAFEENRHEALAAGADDFLRKPIRKDELCAVLESQLGISFLREETSTGEGSPPEAGLTPADLDGLSAEARRRFTHVVRELNPAKIAAELALIREENPELAARLSELTKTMQYRRLWQLLGIVALE
ncbi:MAG: response regulator [Sulfuricella sp.]|nr:response regulator [Sulfuricella sp.]